MSETQGEEGDMVEFPQEDNVEEAENKVQLTVSAEDLVEVPVSFNNESADEVLVFCSYDDFRVAIPLNPTTTKNKKGKTKKSFRGVLSLPPGTHLIRYSVDGEWHCDETQEIVCSRGFEYNSLVVSKDDSEDDDDEKKTRTKSPDNKSSSPSHQTSQSAPAPSATQSHNTPSTPSSEGRKKKKKSRRGKSRHVHTEGDGEGEGQRITTVDASAIREEVNRREKEWREAWILHELRNHQAREAEKQQMRASWASERQLWLEKIKQYANESKDLRSQLLEVQSKLDAAESHKDLTAIALQRNQGRFEQEYKYLKEESASWKKKVDEEKSAKDLLQEEFENIKSQLESQLAEMKTSETRSRIAVDNLKREVADTRSELEQVQKQATEAKADLEKKLTAARNRNKIASNEMAKTKDTLKSTMGSQLMTLTLQQEEKEKQIVALKRDLESITSREKELKDSVTVAEEKVKSITADIEKLKKESNEEQKRLEKSVADLRDQDSKNGRILLATKNELENLKSSSELSQQNFQRDKTEWEAKLAEAKKNAAVSAATDSKSALEASHKKNEDLDKQLSQVRNDLANSLKALSEAKNQSAALEGMIEITKKDDAAKLADIESKLSAEIKHLKEQESKLQASLTDSHKELEHLKGEKHAIEEKLRADVRTTEDRLRDKQKELDMKNQELLDVKDSGTSAIEARERDFNAKFEEKSMALASCQSELAISNKNLTDLKQTKSELTAEIEKLKTDVAASKIQVEQSEQKVRDATEHLNRTEKEKKDLVSQKETMVASFDTKISQLQSDLSTAQGNLDKSLGELDQVKNKLNLTQTDYNRQKAELQRQIDVLSTGRKALKKQILAVTASNKGFRDAVDTVKKDQLALSEEMNKSINDTRNAVLASLTAHSKILDETMKKYKKELSARRKYFNMVQELRGNIRVFCRARPHLSGDTQKGATNCLTFPEENFIFVEQKKNDKPVTSEYEFDRVYGPSASQTDIFKDTKPLIQSVMDGYNVCIFAYGQTGSGKTFTMEGNEENRGVNFRALTELFRIKQQRSKDYVYKISVSMKEIYNEKIRDLLIEQKGTTKESKEDDDALKIMNGERGMYVQGLTSEPVQSEEEILKLFKRGNNNRSIGMTNMNEHSSRSHSLLSVEVEGENLIAGIKYFGKLHLIDLAGSERLSKSLATGDRLKEAQAINKSLSALGNVIEALQKKTAHIPYRNSKLTYLLSDSLGGHAKTLMFINVSPNNTDAEETNCSLQFATRVRKVELGQAVQSKVQGEAPAQGEEGSDEKTAKAKPLTTTGTPSAQAKVTAKTPVSSSTTQKKPPVTTSKPLEKKK